MELALGPIGISSEVVDVVFHECGHMTCTRIRDTKAVARDLIDDPVVVYRTQLTTVLVKTTRSRLELNPTIDARLELFTVHLCVYGLTASS